MKKTILWSTLLIGTLLTASLALADPGNCDACDKKGACQSNGQAQGALDDEQRAERIDQRVMMMSSVLDLTAEQKSQVEVLTRQQWQDKQQLREQMQTNRAALRQLQSAATFDEAEFLATARKQAELKTAMLVAKAQMKQQIYALLTPPQQEKTEQLAELKGARGNGRQAGSGFGF